MVKIRNRIYRILSVSEFKLRNYILDVGETDEFNLYLADMEYVAVRK